MQIDILRGKEHIGGNIIKVTEGDTSVLLDCGSLLPEVGQTAIKDDFDVARIGRVDAVFLSHHHGDHSGLLDKLPPEVSLYAAAETIVFMNQLDCYLGRPPRTAGRSVLCLSDNQPVKVGSLRVTPVAVEHSAEGAAMFIVQGGGKAVLYTGDFKSVPDVSIEGIDLMITEGTMLTRGAQEYPDEAAVERALKEVMLTTKGRVFVLQSSANLPRVRAVVNARNAVPDRPLMQDVFMKYALEETGHKELAVRYAFVWTPFSEAGMRPYDRIARRYCAANAAESYKRIASFDKAVVFLRSSMLDMLTRLIHNGMDISKDALVYSTWRGYEKEPQMAALLELFAQHGIKPQYIHTSGHADKAHILELIRKVAPAKISCIHSESAELIAELTDEIPVESGDRITV